MELSTGYSLSHIKTVEIAVICRNAVMTFDIKGISGEARCNGAVMCCKDWARKFQRSRPGGFRLDVHCHRPNVPPRSANCKEENSPSAIKHNKTFLGTNLPQNATMIDTEINEKRTRCG